MTLLSALLHSILFRTTPICSTRLRSTPLHSTPLHSTPLRCTAPHRTALTVALSVRTNGKPTSTSGIHFELPRTEPGPDNRPAQIAVPLIWLRAQLLLLLLLLLAVHVGVPTAVAAATTFCNDGRAHFG